MFMLAQLGQMGPDVEKGETRRIRRAVKLRRRGRVLFLGRQHIYAVSPRSVTSQRGEKWPESRGIKPVGEEGRYSILPQI